ncbi:MAG: DUF1318 domain-containing protein [Pseudomonadales bacterium]|jgi:hypothetical protein|nr:DUF1318 domain-containing protein [Pseudomonadales bacterium]MDP7360376.1 DUF1318 domain-containing protein [Pseudomonadales bacterium]MDP7595255.1 DUF1318 domain-containing protein [Pseudomonadales bacterium]HJN49714.1 DUF1318 domain-containing protein [Pseudomonadales bacterium]|tara:strand:+ start:2507 stop:2800 length:294 start_codon:yes stop_codon:yes gene_type:complete
MPVPGKFKMIRLTTMLVLLVVAADGWASPLSDAKAAGLVLESADGFVVSAKSAPVKIQKLVADINKRRHEAYKKIADKNGISVEQVGRESYVRRQKK